MMLERILSPDGFELHFTINYLGHRLFTNTIAEKLLSDAGARIVNVASNLWQFSPIRF